MAGLFRRPGLEMPDLGFALLPEYRGEGLALEASQAVKQSAGADLQLGRLAAVTVPENQASIRLLEKLGLGFVEMVRLPGGKDDLAVYEVLLGESRSEQSED